jgi:hypothetical protein
MTIIEALGAVGAAVVNEFAIQCAPDAGYGNGLNTF